MKVVETRIDQTTGHAQNESQISVAMGRISGGKDAGTRAPTQSPRPASLAAACARLIPRTWAGARGLGDACRRNRGMLLAQKARNAF